ncbi:nickel/cobalt transporter [Mesorhizobium australicum]|uniref:Nickel/cobalt efflux system n=1 Tax=Mesorhizobium australicum TaxID=536018 RepID=A0A1X7PKX3_9HYPH|nr:nickel/cobalt transporter [Mesorhizobium australicum]SMH52328.1 ABC-type nickel/cobalt efflux system, permease component RcnA [Mesorhizobium australicum]
MQQKTVRIAFATLAAAYVLTHFAAHAHAASSLGIGTNEAVLPSTGFFSGVLNWINAQQQGFYRQLTTAMKSMRDGGGGAWLLVGLSFAYGIFHAAGPGHGKAVISSYMLANEVALRRGILLSFISAFLQAATAIVVMTLVYFLLRGTSVSMTDATWFLEVSSYVLVTAFGAWLLWKKAGARLVSRLSGRPAHSLSAAVAHAHAGHHHGHDHSHSHATAHAHSHGHDHHGHGHDGHDHHAHSHAHHHHDHAHHAHGPGEVCESCGHSHAPDPALLSSERFDWRAAWAAVASVGIRPCSGALIVLTFAFLNGLWVAGIASVLAMAVGTAITVSALATLAVTAKNVAVTIAGDGRIGNRIHVAVEIAGAALVFLIGLTLLMATV